MKNNKMKDSDKSNNSKKSSLRQEKRDKILKYIKEIYKKENRFVSKREIRKVFHLELYNYFENIFDMYQKVSIDVPLCFCPKDYAINRIIEFVGIIVSVLAGFITVYAQSKDPQTGIILFLSLIGAIFIFFLISWPIDYFRKKMKMIEKNANKISTIEKDLNIVKDKLNFMSNMAKLDKRISIIENTLKTKNKRGQIDPRWVLIIIILILLYLYLRSKGIV